MSSTTKTAAGKKQRTSQWLWFIMLYCSGVFVIGSVYWLIHLLVKILK